MTCPDCNGSGWKITQRGNVSGADRCTCSKVTTRPDEKASLDDYEQAVHIMASVIPFFPQLPDAQGFIVQELINLIDGKQTLQKFTVLTCRSCSKFEGIPSLWRAYESSLESNFNQLEYQRNAERLERYKREFMALPPSERVASQQLPAPKPLPEETPKDTPQTRQDSSEEVPAWLEHLEGVKVSTKPQSWRTAPDWLRKQEGLPTAGDLKQAEQNLATAPRKQRTPEENAAILRNLEKQIGL